MMLTMLSSGTPQAWASTHGLTFPVLQIDDSTAKTYWPNLAGYPSKKMIGKNMVTHASDVWPPPNDAMIQACIATQ